MSSMMEIIRELGSIETRKGVALARRREIERQARRNSSMVTGQARRLITVAVLGLLESHQVIDRASLKSEVQKRAGKRDRFAVELCKDWLEDPLSPPSEQPP